MNPTAALRVSLLVLLAAALAGPAALARDARRKRSRSPENFTLTVGLDGGKGDEEFGGNLFQPFVTLGSYGSGFDWEARARGLLTDEEDGIRSSGAEGRLMLGWGWQERKSYSASLLVGGSFRTLRVEVDEELTSDFGPSKYDCKITAAEVGARFRMPGGDGVELIAEVSAGPVLAFSDDQDNGLDGGLRDSYVFETYLGFSWAIREIGASVTVGGAYEQLKVRREDGFSLEMEKVVVRVGLVWTF